MPQLELVRPIEIDVEAPAARADHAVIGRIVPARAKVLDIGCGDGALLHLLARERGVRGRGLELDQARVNACVTRGLSVVQGDADRDLAAFPSASFEYVILSHTLQVLKRPREALKQAARVGEHVIVSIDNAAHWKSRFALMTGGRVRASKGTTWGDASVLHPMSVRDFSDLARELGLVIERGVPLSGGHHGAPFAKTLWRANWFAQQAIFQVAWR